MKRTDWQRTEGEVWHATPVAPGCPHCGEASRGASPRFDWSFLDAAYCISLRGRPDRAAAAAAEFHRVGLCERVTFFRPEKDLVSVRLGIWQSHRTVAGHALRRGRSTVLICEDDVMFSERIGPAAVGAIAAAMPALPEDWMVLYLGPLAALGLFRAPQPAALRLGLLSCLHSERAHAALAVRQPARQRADRPDRRTRRRCGVRPAARDLCHVSDARDPAARPQR